MSFVYVISNEIYAKNNIYKIGKADNVKTRLTILSELFPLKSRDFSCQRPNLLILTKKRSRG